MLGGNTTLELVATVLGATGSGLGVWNFFSNVRTRTIVSQAPLLNDLRTQFENCRAAANTLPPLFIDRLDLTRDPTPRIGPVPQAFRDAITEIPLIARQLISPNELRINAIHTTVTQTAEDWDTVHSRPLNEDIDYRIVVDTANRLRETTYALIPTLDEYCTALGKIGKGGLYTRWRYKRRPESRLRIAHRNYRGLQRLRHGRR
jgi:hypothetical protein